MEQVKEEAVQNESNSLKEHLEKTSNGKFKYDHILDAQKNKGKGLRIDLEYDPIVFWQSIGKTYYNNFQKKEQYQIGVGWVLDRLKTLQVDDLLDCGTGFARMLPFFIEGGGIKSAVGIDVSKDLIECSKEYLAPDDQVWCEHIKFQDGSWIFDQLKVDDWKTCPKCDAQKPAKLEKQLPDFQKLIRIEEGDVRKLQFESDSFDCTFSFECLQHLSDEDVEDSLREMVRVSKRVIILCERWAFPGERFEPHYFSHNYVDKLKSLGVDILQVSAIGSGLQGVVAKKR